MTRILISADMEGICGINRFDQIDPNHMNNRFRELFEEEVNHVVSCITTDFEKVVVDAHASGDNLRLENLKDVKYLIQGPQRPLGMMQGIEEVDAVIFVGYHGRSQEESVLHHTHSSAVWQKVVIDGNEAGEVTINYLLAQALGKRVLFVSGTDAATAEASKLGIKNTVCTKHSISIQACIHRNRQIVFEEYKESLSNLKVQQTICRNEPVKWCMEFDLKEQTSFAAEFSSVEKINDCTVQIHGDTFKEQYLKYYEVFRGLLEAKLTRSVA